MKIWPGDNQLDHEQRNNEMTEHTVVQQHKTPPPTATPWRSGILQRKCACGQHTVAGGECAGCRKKRLQRKSSGHTDPETVPPIVHEVLRSPGQPLDAETRAFMEPRFGHDFSQVRVHTDAKAAESARAVNALAYTVGNSIVFGADEYTSGTIAGKRLLAHELVHTIQQTGTPQAHIKVGEPRDRSEREAELASAKVIQGYQRPKITTADQSAVLRRVSAREEIEWERANPAGRVERTTDGGMTMIILWNFAVGRADIKPEHGRVLIDIADRFRDLPAHFLLDIEGHSSSTGSETRNQTISENRARMVEAFLRREGVFGPMLISSGQGELEPLVPNTTAENMAKNRRVEIRVARLT